MLDFAADFESVEREVFQLWREGKMHVCETVYLGIESMARAYVDMLRGANVGKMQVEVRELAPGEVASFAEQGDQ